MSGIEFHNAFTIVISLAFLAISLGLIAFAIRQALDNNHQIERRLAGGAGDLDIDQPRKKSALDLFGSKLTLPDAKDLTRIAFELAQAGYHDPSAVKTYHALRVLCLFVPQIILAFFWGKLLAVTSPALVAFLACLSLLICLFAPSLFVRWRAKKRTDDCRRGFPDMMDLMIACIEAGLSMDAALIRVSHEIGGRYPALKFNLDLMNLELRAGRGRNDAMMSFAERVNLEEAKSLAVMLKQAEEMGSSLGKTLRTFADEMRLKRMMLAEEKAMALSAKLTVPLILFIFPTILVLVLLPAGIRIADGIG